MSRTQPHNKRKRLALEKTLGSIYEMIFSGLSVFEKCNIMHLKAARASSVIIL